MGTFWIALGVGALWTAVGVAIWGCLYISGALSRIEERAADAYDTPAALATDLQTRMEALESRQATLHEEMTHRWQKIAARDRRAKAVAEEDVEDLDEETARALLARAANAGGNQEAPTEGRKRLVPRRSLRRW